MIDQNKPFLGVGKCTFSFEVEGKLITFATTEIIIRKPTESKKDEPNKQT